MTDNPEQLSFTDAGRLLQAVRDQINSVLIGQHRVVDHVLVALLANGHVLLEGVPGLGKTLLVRSLAHCFNGQFKRIQFTPDLMPADITGHAIYDMNSGKFRLRRGPVFTNLLLADEINRSPAKTQAALLEVMQEQQVTIEGDSLKLSLPFMVLATQNPIEQEGTYPLPEAELDRFLMKIYIDYPAHEDEITLTRHSLTGHVEGQLTPSDGPLLTAETVIALQRLSEAVTVDDQITDYAVRLVRATRDHAAIFRGAGPRASIGLVRSASAHALLRGGEFVLPDDIKAVALPVMRHRIALSADTEIEGQSADLVISRILDMVEAPRA